ncbi:RNB domain-containing ribonuclease [Streptomyces sp. NPDC002574]|uniref:RNB domain-containing ribonuclease n=1 Tax=Streptomyces sp. NPDC002574 TaxID=3364652 RepID=UPI00367B08B7
MPRRPLRVKAADGEPLRTALSALRTELHVPAAFPPAVLAEAEQAAGAPGLDGHEDATGLPLFTIDPPGSRDLDQAMHLARRDGGYRVHYAIADVAAFVAPGGAIDTEAQRRVTTLYFPDVRVPLHPTVLSEDAASLLPGRDRLALLWRIDLDADGGVTGVDVRRARVRSRARLDYAGVQRDLDDGTAEEPLTLLRTIGRLRQEQERRRGGISLDVPEQEVIERGDGYALEYRAPLPAESWNAQISLLAGMAAAGLMIAAGTGILRTLPLAPHGEVARLRRVAQALHIDWPHMTSYAELIRSLDPARTGHAAFLHEATSLFRGADYTPFWPGHPASPLLHAAVADAYTHCTAPLRRLVDRYAGEFCLAASAGRTPPEWVTDAYRDLPHRMRTGSQLASRIEGASVSIVEAALLEDRVGEVFDAYVIDVRENDPTAGTVHLRDPAVVARVRGGDTPLALGEPLRVRLTEADVARHTLLFAPA